MIRPWFFIALLAVAANAASDQKPFLPPLLIGALGPQDRQHFLDTFSNFKKDSIKEAHYAYLGNSALNIGSIDGISCEALKSNFDSSDVETQYYALSAARGIKSCAPTILKPNRLSDILKDEKLTVDQLYYIVSSAIIANVSIGKSEVLKLLNKFAEKETSPSGLSSVLATAALVKGTTAKELEAFSPLVAKTVEQADESDGILLFFERGAYTTAFAIESIFQFAAAIKKAPALTEQQAIKFSNFLYERRRAHQIRTSARLASAFKILATNSFMNPIAVLGVTASERAGISGILVPPSRRLQIRFFNIFGSQLGAELTVQAGALYPDGEKAKPFGPTSLGEFKRTNDLFELDLGAKASALPRGRYNLELTAKQTQKGPSPGALIGVTKAMIPLRVISPVKVEKAHLVVSDASKTLVDSELTFPGSHSEVIRMHHTSRLRLTFTLEDAVAPGVQSAPAPQQVFVQLTHSMTHQSITFLTKRSITDETYSFSLSLDSASADFDYVSGIYKMEVLVGDALVETPIIWHVADLDLHFLVNEGIIAGSSFGTEDVARLTVSSMAARKRSAHPLIGEASRSQKPLIEHTFRKPEPRPPDLVAFAFTGLCCAPLVILILVWPLMGANLSNFNCSLSSLLFHLGLGAIFGLYLIYWYKLNMFTTLRYLFFLGLFTFVSGNRLLRQLVTKRRKRQE
ncbi:hypothetical protein Aperf_G00000131169 [Anoplocephala perfoliata]